jgi:hypothetical protein
VSQSEAQGVHTCEACGSGGPLVQFGVAGEYRYHCLRCWKRAGEWVAVEYAMGEDGEAPAPDAVT